MKGFRHGEFGDLHRIAGWGDPIRCRPYPPR
jgi:hypothetical protein